MRILVITYSREVNPGTFLQAYGVQYAFRQFFPNAEIELLKHKRLYMLTGVKVDSSKHSKKDWNWLKGRVLAIPRRLKYEWYNIRKFRFSKQEFDLFDYDQDEFKTFAEAYDLIVVGSDTILINLKKNDKYGLMWLLGIDTNIVLFAASASPAIFSLTDDENKILNERFSSFKYLGVRDSVTEKLLSEKIGLGDKVIRQFDPTYLIPDSHFKLPFILKQKLESIRNEKKIALVNFGADFFGKKELTEHLRQKGYYTVSTVYNPWADSNIMTLSAFGWAALFRHIDIAITERFHDSVFALRNNKAVIAVDWAENRFAADGSSKTSCILESYGLADLHLVCRSDKDLEKLYGMIDNVNRFYDENKIMLVNREIASGYQSQMKKIKETLVKNNDGLTVSWGRYTYNKNNTSDTMDS